jgi:hypothetical protein
MHDLYNSHTHTYMVFINQSSPQQQASFSLTSHHTRNNKAQGTPPCSPLVLPAGIPCPKQKQETMAPHINVRRRRSPSYLWPAAAAAAAAAAAVAILALVPTALAHASSHSHHHAGSSSGPNVAHTHHQGKD